MANKCSTSGSCDAKEVIPGFRQLYLATVLTSYMNIGAVPDNRYDDNMRQISESFFNSDFWYRTTIEYKPSANKQQHTYLNFDGINWKANILLNGEKIGRIDGAFIRSRIDITKKLKL